MKMNTRLIIGGVMAIAITTNSARAQGTFRAPDTVQERQFGASTEYTVVNNSNSLSVLPFDIVAFAVRSAGGNPFTANPAWTAEALNAATWSQPMGGNAGQPSWADYTRMLYTEAFPGNPAEVNGYVVDFGSGQAVSEGTSQDGFFFQGAPGLDDRFMLVGAHGPAIVQGQIITEFGTVQIIPEPVGLGLVSLLTLTVWRRRFRLQIFAECARSVLGR